MSNPENPSAFPVATIDGYVADGMTLRDYFAAAALTGLLAGRYRDNSSHNLSEVPEEAGKIADAMLAERSKQ